jgi:ABC-type amino acid transport substrate-binding protein
MNTLHKSLIITFLAVSIFISGLNVDLVGAQKMVSKPMFTLTPEERAWLNAHPVISLVSTGYCPPFVYWDNKEQKQKGFDIDYMNLLSRKLGTPIEIRLTKWGEAVQMAKDHKVEGLFPAAISEDRKPYLEWSDIYISSPLSLVTYSDAPRIGACRE